MTRAHISRGGRYRTSRLQLFGDGLLSVYRLPVRWEDHVLAPRQDGGARMTE